MGFITDDKLTASVESNTNNIPASIPAACNDKDDSQGVLFPKSNPDRFSYLCWRWLSVATASYLIALSIVAFRMYNLSRWASPVLSTAVSSWFCSIVDALLVQLLSRRYHRLQRLFHDGGIAVGYIIALGFIAAFTANWVKCKETLDDNPVCVDSNVPVPAGLIMFGMVVDM
jgi:hypothetical protein